MGCPSWAKLRCLVAVLAFLFTILAVVFFLLSFGALASDPDLTKAGGILGIATAAVAWYLCLAGVMASTFGRAILPNRPLFRASASQTEGQT